MQEDIKDNGTEQTTETPAEGRGTHLTGMVTPWISAAAIGLMLISIIVGIFIGRF